VAGDASYCDSSLHLFIHCLFMTAAVTFMFFFVILFIFSFFMLLLNFISTNV